MTETKHLDRRFLLAFSRGEMPLQFIAKMGFEHLAELCPHCRQELLAAQDRISGGKERAASIPVMQAVLKSSLSELRRQHRQAERDFRELLALPAEEQLGKIHKARRRFKGVPLVHLLLGHAEQYFTKDTKKAQHYSRLAHAVVRYSPAASEVFELEALIKAYLGNACRAAGNFREADGYFGDARQYIRYHAVTDPAILGRIDELEGSLRKDQRQFETAEELLARALVLFGMSGGLTGEIGRVLVKLGDLYFVQGKPAAAAEMTRFSLQLLEPDRHPQLYLCARYNLALQLAEAGEFEAAAGILESDASLFTRFDEPWTQLRLLCVKAKIADARGDRATAVRLFQEARQGFIRQGIGFDVAIVSVELALLHLRAGDTAAVKALAEEMVSLFEAQEIHREATAALLLFQEAARLEAATVELAEELTTYLKRARENPDLRFKRGPRGTSPASKTAKVVSPP